MSSLPSTTGVTVGDGEGVASVGEGLAVVGVDSTLGAPPDWLLQPLNATSAAHAAALIL